MQIKLKPQILRSRNKMDLISKINRLAGHYGHTTPLTTDSEIVLYNLEKCRKKTKVNKRKKKLTSLQGTSYQRDIVKQKNGRLLFTLSLKSS